MVSAERPMMNMNVVSVAVRNGDENEENRVATATTMVTSQAARIAEARTSCRSSGMGQASAHAVAASTGAQGTTTNTRERGKRSAATHAAAAMPPISAATLPTA